jgi:hypothetical protein
LNHRLKILASVTLSFLVVCSGYARAEIMIVGIDRKFAFDLEGKRQGACSRQ